MSKILLSGNDWKLVGWVKHQWHYGKVMETNGFSAPVVTEIPATVPGSVQTDLFNNGVIEDWNIGTNFRNIEWVENREWVYTKTFNASEKADKYYLYFEGLDFNGFVFLNDKQVLEFNEMMIPYRVDVTDAIYLDKENQLKIVFLQPPEVDGQVGYTSKTSILKSRFNYGWDWCPRLVNIGIFGDVWFEAVNTAYIEDFYPKTTLYENGGCLCGELTLACLDKAELSVSLALKKDDKIIDKTEGSFSAVKGTNDITLNLNSLNVENWFPLGFGNQPLYTAVITVCDKDGNVITTNKKQVGFRKIEYVVPDGAPENCLPYSVKINGRFIPLRGIDWVPLSPFYGSVREKDYRFILERFAKMNCNIIRVWGGANKETETFYDLCDKLGIMVWQDFPQSSSGIDNTPNEDPAYIENLLKISKQHILHTRSHVSLTYWCSGNELYLPNYLPVDEEISGNIRALGNLVREHNPEILYLPDTPSRIPDPRFNGESEGGWINGDAHGPWDYIGPDRHYTYFYEEKSLLFSEVGAPSSARPEIIKKCCTKDIWPPSYRNEFWSSRGAWWIRLDELTELFGNFEDYPDRLAAYIAASRFTQAEALKTTCAAIRYFDAKRTGLIVWMGAEPFPNAQNTSLLEFDGYAKPAFYETKKGFSHQLGGLKYDRPYADEKGEIKFTPFLCTDNEFDFGTIQISIFNEKGEETETFNFENVKDCGTITLADIKFKIEGEINLVRMTSSALNGILGEWVFTKKKENLFAPLLKSEKCDLEVVKLSACEFVITNKSPRISYFNEIGAFSKDNTPLLTDKNFFSLLPNEVVTVKIDGKASKFNITQMNQL